MKVFMVQWWVTVDGKEKVGSQLFKALESARAYADKLTDACFLLGVHFPIVINESEVQD